MVAAQLILVEMTVYFLPLPLPQEVEAVLEIQAFPKLAGLAAAALAVMRHQAPLQTDRLETHLLRLHRKEAVVVTETARLLFEAAAEEAHQRQAQTEVEQVMAGQVVLIQEPIMQAAAARDRAGRLDLAAQAAAVMGRQTALRQQQEPQIEAAVVAEAANLF